MENIKSKECFKCGKQLVDERGNHLFNYYTMAMRYNSKNADKPLFDLYFCEECVGNIYDMQTLYK